MARFEILSGQYSSFRLNEVGEDFFMPVVYLTSEREDEGEVPVLTVMDTGSSIILLKLGYAAHILHKDPKEVKSSKDRINLKGLGNGVGYGWKTDLRLRSAQYDRQFMSIPNAWIFATESNLPYSGLFGQISGMQQRWLKHHNHSARRYWQLREWK